MKSRAHIFVSGIVQGVYFREFTRSQARALGLTGWVRNLPDRRVEAMVEGECETVNLLIDHLWSGPPSSSVDDIRVRWEEYVDSFHDFQIKY